MSTKIFFAALIVALTSIANAQYDSKGENKSRFKPGAGWFFKGWRPQAEKKVNKYDRFIVDVFYNDFYGDETKPFKIGANSLGYNINFLADKPLNASNSAALGYGLQYGYSHYQINQGFYQNGSKMGIPTWGDYSINTHQVGIPIEFRFRKDSWKHFKIHIGGSINYTFAYNHQLDLTSNNYETQIITRKSDDLTRLNYGAHVRIGVRNWAIYAQYNFSEFYNQKSGAYYPGYQDVGAVNTFKMGLSLSLF